MMELLARIGAGAVTGVGVAVFGFFKNRQTAEQDFDEKRLVQTVIVGAFVGGVAGELGMTYTSAYDYLASVGGITFIEWIKKIVWKKISG